LALFFNVAGAGPFALAPVTAALFLAGAFAGESSLGLFFFEPLAEFLAGEEAIHLAGALALDLEFDPGGRVLKKDAGGGFINLLPAAAGAADEFFDEVFFENPQGGHAPFEGFFFIR
jgi:hypothetical protein